MLTNVGAHFIGYMPSGASPEAPILKDPAEGFVSAGAASALFPVAQVGKTKKLPSVRDASPYLCFRIRSQKDGRVFVVGGFDPSCSVSEGAESHPRTAPCTCGAAFSWLSQRGE